MANRVGLAVDGYLQLAEYLVEQWRDRATQLAQQIESRDVSPDTMVKTAQDWMTMAFQSVALVVNEAFDASEAMRGSEDKPHVVVSATFDTSGGNGAHAVRTLELDGPLVADLGHDAIPASAVTMRPDSLAPQQTSFELVVDGTGHPALGYSGHVIVRDAQGGQIESVDVWVMT